MTEVDGGGKRNVSAQLGCGTLILIAIIVTMFSGRGDIRDARNEIEALREQVTRLEQKIDSVLVRMD